MKLQPDEVAALYRHERTAWWEAENHVWQSAVIADTLHAALPKSVRRFLDETRKAAAECQAMDPYFNPLTWEELEIEGRFPAIGQAIRDYDFKMRQSAAVSEGETGWPAAGTEDFVREFQTWVEAQPEAAAETLLHWLRRLVLPYQNDLRIAVDALRALPGERGAEMAAEMERVLVALDLNESTGLASPAMAERS